jgi:mono/diheme cytochrome c family protein
MLRKLGGAFLLLGIAACQTAPQEPSALVVGKPAQSNGGENPAGSLAFAQAACGGCHAVERGALSPAPAAPAFADIANREGLTAASLAAWLRDAHNYPEEMEFDLQGPQVDVLAEYILTLRESGYRAPIS